MLGLNLTEEPRAIREAKEEGRQEGRQEGRREGRQEGRQEGEKSLILRLLVKKVGELDQSMRDRVSNLPSEQLEDLSNVLLDFTKLADLEDWFTDHE